jgi:hypothetical protein
MAAALGFVESAGLDGSVSVGTLRLAFRLSRARWIASARARRAARSSLSVLDGMCRLRHMSRPATTARDADFRFPSPLIEPDVTISVIRLSDGFHMEACAARRR